MAVTNSPMRIVVVALSFSFTNLAIAAEFPRLTALMEQYCVECHDAEAKKGDLDLDLLLSADFRKNRATWETVVRRLDARQMPPSGKAKPDDTSYDTALAELVEKLDTLPVNPGRPPTFRRLTRTEYQNSIRDLLGLQIDPAKWLAKDESSHGFDNITVDEWSPTSLDRFLTAAEEISQLAVGRVASPHGRTIRVRPDLTQDRHFRGTPARHPGWRRRRAPFSSDGRLRNRSSTCSGSQRTRRGIARRTSVGDLDRRFA